MKTKPIQITEVNGELNTLCSDGSIWVYRDSQFIALFEMEKKVRAPTKNNLKEEQKKFYETLKDYTETYDKSMLRAFFNYWSESSQAGNKMRCQLERTWDTKKRLVTWASRSTVAPLAPTTNNTPIFDHESQRKAEQEAMSRLNVT